MRTTGTLLSVLAFLFFVFYFPVACKKSDHFISRNVWVQPQDVGKRFYDLSANIDPTLIAIQNSIRTQDQAAHFVPELVNRSGYPLWRKAKSFQNGHAAAITRGGVRGNYEFYYIPFAKDTSNFIGAVLIVRVGANDTLFHMLYHWQYADFGFTKTSDSIWAASDVFHLFTSFQKEVFGQTRFLIEDNRLLKSRYANLEGVTVTIKSTGLDSLALNGAAGEDCDGYDMCFNPDDVPGGSQQCPGGGCYRGCQYWLYEEWYCTDFTVTQGGGGTGGQGAGGTPGGGSGGGGGNWYDNPCRSIAAAGGTNPCDGGSGGTVSPGWQPIGSNSSMLSYLTSQLDLSLAQIAWLQNHLEMQTELYNYLQGNADPQAATTTALLHLTTMMNNPDYLQFVLGHQATGSAGMVWWLDQTWVSDPNNFWLGLTEGQQQQLTAQEQVLIARYPAQAFIIRHNIQPAYLEQARRFPNSNGSNDKSDAFRHAYFSALNTRDCPPGGMPPVSGSQIVAFFGDAHESDVPQQLHLESEMDIFNNGVGINYCSFCFPSITPSSSISDGIMTLLNNGDLRYLKPINYTDPHFNGGSGVPPTHGITSSTVLTPTNQ